MTSLGDSGCFLAFGLSSLGGAGLGFEVSDFENVLLNRILDGIGVERFWRFSGIPFGLCTLEVRGNREGSGRLGDSLGDSGCLAFGLSSLGGAGLGFEVWLPVAVLYP